MAKQPALYTHYTGSLLLDNPLLNKGSAFTEEERPRQSVYGRSIRSAD